MRRTFVIGSILCAGAFIGAYLIENLRLPLAVLAFAGLMLVVIHYA